MRPVREAAPQPQSARPPARRHQDQGSGRVPLPGTGYGKVNRRAVQPYGIIYGNRAFLVGHTELGSNLHLWRLANISGARTTG